ncbi:hypothetical protein WT60_00925 [Burkholderia sp. MSMB617WGS]|nr:hypothetical protein WS86_01305 [Burkholderia savannae]AOK45576.1 hypothetical protein WT60_00925 [Burkholderia sp. MSMB617WGS]
MALAITIRVAVDTMGCGLDGMFCIRGVLGLKNAEHEKRRESRLFATFIITSPRSHSPHRIIFWGLINSPKQ